LSASALSTIGTSTPTTLHKDNNPTPETGSC
jgi:hypothetical protein